jgi:TatD DNase family protein
MASDAHAHPFDLRKLEGDAPRSRDRIAIAASAWSAEEWEYHRTLAEQRVRRGGAALVLCFAVHPQLPASDGASVPQSLETLEQLVGENKINAVGEAGFDLYDGVFRATEDLQVELFNAQLSLARKAQLPMVLHVRKAMDRIFALSRPLSDLPAVIFHSYSGTLGEAEALLRRGVNAYFSFGTTILLNHKQAMTVCAKLPPERLLFETDAPYQGLRGRPYSVPEDLYAIIEAAAQLRREAVSPVEEKEELERVSDENFRKAYGI